MERWIFQDRKQVNSIQDSHTEFPLGQKGSGDPDIDFEVFIASVCHRFAF